MKKLIAILLIIVFALCLTACQTSNGDDKYSSYSYQDSDSDEDESADNLLYSCSYTTYISQKTTSASKTKSSVVEDEYSTPDKYLMNTYVQILTSNALLQETCKYLKIETYTAAELKQMVNAQAVDDSYIIRVTVNAGNPDDALKIANAHLGTAPKYISTIIQGCVMKIIDTPGTPTRRE